MPYASGTFSLYSTGNPVVTGTTISSSWANNTLNDIATGLSTCVLKDGTQTITANLPMAGFKLTGLAAGSTAGDSLRYEQLVGVYLPLAGGTMTGNLLFTDATYDIGASGATRPRDLFLSRNAVIGGTLNVTGHPTLEGVTATGATGTGNLVFDISPTFTTPTLGAASATSLTGTAIATQTDQETATSATTVVSPARQQFHPSAAKAWGVITPNTTVTASYPASGVSVTKNGTGDYTVTHGCTFSSTGYATIVQANKSSAILFAGMSAQTTTTFSVRFSDANTNATDPDVFYYACFGDL